MKRIIVIGGGFAGVNLIQHLKACDDVTVTLVDRNNYNFFPPLLYQVATGYLEASSISFPFRKLFRHRPEVRFHMGELLRVEPENHRVILSTGEMFYDLLIFATGAETNYFGNENVRHQALPMKTIEDAINLRNHFLLSLEKASRTENAAEREKLRTVVIAGAGPTGVEVSGMLAEIRKNILPKDYPELAKAGGNSHIYLVDGGAKVLGPMSATAQDYTYETLLDMGVEIKLNKHVKDFTDGKVIFNDGEEIVTGTLVWAAGVAASIFQGIPETSIGRGRRMLVDQFNRVAGLNDIFAIGDTALMPDAPGYPNGHPQLAQVAIQQGKNLALNLLKLSKGKNMAAFNYIDRGTMAVIGRNKAVADLPHPRLNLKGILAWLMWVIVHLVSLLDFRNKIKTLWNWTGAYLTRDQYLRFIIRPDKTND